MASLSLAFSASKYGRTRVVSSKTPRTASRDTDATRYACPGASETPCNAAMLSTLCKAPTCYILQTRVHTLCRLAFLVCPHLKLAAAACRAQSIRTAILAGRVCLSLPHVLLNTDLHTTHLAPLQTADTENWQPPEGVSRRYSLTPRRGTVAHRYRAYLTAPRCWCT